MDNFLGVSPLGTFSGYETSIFRAIEDLGFSCDRIQAELPLYKALCYFKSFHPKRSKWGQRFDYCYHASPRAFSLKSNYVQNCVCRCINNNTKFIFQIGVLWDPLPLQVDLPLIVCVDYTPKLSQKRGSEWMRKPGFDQEFWDKAVSDVFNKADILCTVTHNAKRSLIADYNIPEKKIFVINPAISARGYENASGLFPQYGSKKLLFVGKGVKGKGLDTLLSAFKQVRKRIPDARLTIVGPASAIEGEGVDYLGRIKGDQKIMNLYYSHAIFVLPTIYEPVGQVFLEAMSCKLPCIGTTLDAMPEIIEDGVTGYTISPGDIDMLTEKIVFLLLNPDISMNMGKMGFDKFGKSFTWDVVKKNLGSVIGQIGKPTSSL